MVFNDSVNVKIAFVILALIPYLSRCENSGNVTGNVTSNVTHGLAKSKATVVPKVKSEHDNVTVHNASISSKNSNSLAKMSTKSNSSKTVSSELEWNGNWMEGGPVLAKHATIIVHTSKMNDTLTNIKTNVSSTAHTVHKYISARKGAPAPVKPEIDISKLNNSHNPYSSPIIRPKPLFTMVQGDKIMKESESFIESPTTGKDYVLPIVLVIFAVPGFIFLVKFLYKRGTEFTERQQYHRMYLIDVIVMYISYFACAFPFLWSAGAPGPI